MKKLLIYAWLGESQEKAIQSLENSGYIEVVRRLDVFKSIDEVLYRPFDADVNLCLSHEQRLAMAKIKDVFLSMYSRISLSEGASYEDLTHYFWRYVAIVNKWLVDGRPDVVFIAYPPHMGLDYVLYELCKVKGVPVKIFFQTLFTDRFLVLDDIDDLDRLNKLPAVSEPIFKVEDFRHKEWFYMKKIKTYNKFCFLSFMNNFLLKSFARKPLTKEGSVRIYSNCKAFKKWRTQFSNHSPDLSEKYIYFPLQLQPEMTTSTLGAPIYSDQLNAIEELQALLPEGWKIYVKENPKQTPRQRSDLFFRRLKACSKVVYISSEFSSHKLIKHSQGVAVVTGTAGWEALIEGIPVITFGKAWYNSFPGVFKYSEGVSFSEFSAFVSDPKALQKALDKITQVMHEGVIDPVYEVSVENFTAESNQKKLEMAVKTILGS